MKKLSTAFRRKLLKVTAVILAVSILLAVVSLLTVIQLSTSGLLRSNLTEITTNIAHEAETGFNYVGVYVDYEFVGDDLEAIANGLAFIRAPEWYIIDDGNVILASSEADMAGKDVSGNEVFEDFRDKLSDAEPDTTYSRPITLDELRGEHWSKWVGASLSDGRFAAVRFKPEQYYHELDDFITKICGFQTVGSSGFDLIVKYDGTVISAPYQTTESVKAIPETIDVGNLLTKSDENSVFQITVGGENYYAMYEQCDGYYAISLLPCNEVTHSWYLLMSIIALLVLIMMVIIFLRINSLTDRLIVKNIGKINRELSEITDGNLDTEIDVRDYVEFKQLSDGINTTVSALKGYIAKESERLNEELELAHSIQTSALPNVFPPYPDRRDIDVYAVMKPAKEVGGDFYDFFFTDSTHFVFLAADVSDKGIPAAMFMMKAKTIIKSLAQANHSAEKVIAIANNALCENNSADMFVTLWFGVLDTETGVVSYVNAGHCKPLLRRADGAFSFIKAKADFVVGGEEGIDYHRHELQLSEGDALLLYTDGVTEAANIREELFGEDRLSLSLNEKQTTTARNICETLYADVKSYAEGATQTDDITMLVVVFHGVPRREITAEATTEHLTEVYDFLEERLYASGFEPVAVSQLGVIADEICANIVHYAYTGGAQGTLTVSYAFHAATDEAEITFIDHGVPFNPLNAPEPDVSNAENRAEGGMGIFLIRKFSDKVLYEYAGNENRLTIIKRRGAKKTDHTNLH